MLGCTGGDETASIAQTLWGGGQEMIGGGQQGLVACRHLVVVVERVTAVVNIMVLDRKVNSIVEDLVLPKLQQ